MAAVITSSDILIFKHGNVNYPSIGVPADTVFITQRVSVDTPNVSCAIDASNPGTTHMNSHGLNPVSSSINELFDAVQPSEAYAGDVEYRVIYVQNNNSSVSALGLKIYIYSQTSSSNTSVKIGLGTGAAFPLVTEVLAAPNTTLCTGLGNVTGWVYGYPENTFEAEIADEGTAPAGVTFYTAADIANALSIGDLPPGYAKAVWIEWTVNAGAAATASDSMTLAITNAVS